MTTRTRTGGKGSVVKPLPAAGSQPGLSSMVGGVGNMSSPPATKRGVQGFSNGGIVQKTVPDHVQGGFRNRGMANRR